MNREILFRGKDKLGVWHYGHLHIDTLREDDKYYINSSISINNINFIEVIKESVGQYTGLDDKFGNKIFEKDIVNIGETEEVDVVSWSDGGEFAIGFGLFSCFEYEIIGNIYENPNLLQQKENDRI